MTEQGMDDKYIKCSRCVRKFINDNDHIKNDFGYNRLEERFKTCVQCRDKKRNMNSYSLYKEYYEENRDAILEYKRQYRENNKDKIQEQVLCDVCGSSVSRPGMAKHKKTNKCVNHKNRECL